MGIFNRKPRTPEPLIPSPNTTIIIPEQRTDDRRPCWACGRRALFHRWAASAHPVLPRGVEPSENARYYQFRNVTALVEYEDGTVGRVYPNEIQFADGGGFDKFTWPPSEKGAGNG